MELEILGAHNCESRDAKLTSLLIDSTVAIDVGSLTSSLSLETQKKVRAILITHRHFDHIRDLATFGMNVYSSGPVNVYALDSVLDIISTHLLNDIVYPDFRKKPLPEKPALKFYPLEPNKELIIEGYTVLLKGILLYLLQCITMSPQLAIRLRPRMERASSTLVIREEIPLLYGRRFLQDFSSPR